MRLFSALLISTALFVLVACGDNATVVGDSAQSEYVFPAQPSDFDLNHYYGPLEHKGHAIAKPECNQKYELVFSLSFDFNCALSADLKPYVERTSKYWCDQIEEACKYQDCKKTHWDVLKWRYECEGNTLTIYILVEFACEG